MATLQFATLKGTIYRALRHAGMTSEDAEVCARVHTESTVDGVSSHGVNRVARFIEFIQRGFVQLGVRPQQVRQLAALEVYDGQRGPGVLNALWCMERGMELAAEQGLALIGLRNTNHWMRGGTYGWHAAERGFILIAWTNTESCMPAWGGRDVRLGNNPFIMAAPKPGGAMVLDMAMSQYAYGKLQVTRLKGERLPFPGGFDLNGELTDDPGAIEESRRILPIGLWKGSVFAMMLDLLAATLSEGLATHAIDKLDLGSCVGCSQVFILIDPRKLGGDATAAAIAADLADYIHDSVPDEAGRSPEYPGEGAKRRRERQMLHGIEVDDGVWRELVELALEPASSSSEEPIAPADE